MDLRESELIVGFALQATGRPWGDVLQIGLRIMETVLLGLAVLPIRGRVKR
jgi:hypothetical protein